MSLMSGAWHESYARRDLKSLADRLDAAGLIPGALGPGGTACVDQHAAAIRDILTFSGGRTSTVELAAYAQGVLDQAAESGWTPESGAAPSDWVSLRLMAVCSLATSVLSPSATARGIDDTDGTGGLDDLNGMDPLLFT